MAFAPFEEALRERRRRGITEVSTNRMLELIADGKSDAEAASILDWPPGIFEERRRTLTQLYDVDSLEDAVAAQVRLDSQRKVKHSRSAQASESESALQLRR